MLALGTSAFSNALVTEDELLHACKRLGRERLLLMLEGKNPSGDPDLQPGGINNLHCARMSRLVARHARELLAQDGGPHSPD